MYVLNATLNERIAIDYIYAADDEPTAHRKFISYY